MAHEPAQSPASDDEAEQINPPSSPDGEAGESPIQDTAHIDDNTPSPPNEASPENDETGIQHTADQGSPPSSQNTAPPPTPSQQTPSASPPASPTLSLPPTPRTPRPWLWKCGRCGVRQIVVAAARCLKCGHHLCNTRNVQNFEGAQSPLPSPGGHQPWAKATPRRPPTPIPRKDMFGRKGGKTSHRRCPPAMVDHSGWRRWQTWRRETLAATLVYAAARDLNTPAGDGEDDDDRLMHLAREYLRYVPGTAGWHTEDERRRRRKLRRRILAAMDRERHDRMASREHDCSVDCDWPRECHLAWERADAARQEEEEDEDEDEEEEYEEYEDENEDDVEYMDYILMGEDEDQNENVEQQQEEEEEEVKTREMDDDEETVVPDTTQSDQGDDDQWADTDAYPCPYEVQYINGQAYPVYQAVRPQYSGQWRPMNPFAQHEPHIPATEEAATKESEDGAKCPVDPALWNTHEQTNGMSGDDEQEVEVGRAAEGREQEGESERDDGDDAAERLLLELHTAMMAGQF